jgi:release factor glutamine methyltransferase
LKNCPVDNIFKKAYFYGLQFKVNDNVLSPRPESEMLVDCALNKIEKNKFKTVLDLCSGSGCLAISIKKNSNTIVDAVDISKKAIKVAKFNAKQNDVQINFIQSDMFDLLTKTYDLIISNPPYIESKIIKTLDKEVQNHDPILALDGGADGLEFYKIINNNLDKYLNINGILILEIGDDQKEKIINLFNNYLLIDAIKDYGNNDRVLIFKKTKINLK